MNGSISEGTVGMMLPVVKGLSASGALPKEEAARLNAVIRAAAKVKPPAKVDRRRALATRHEAAEYLACSTKTVDRLLDDKALARVYLRPGNAKSLRIRVSELEAFANGAA